MADGGGCDDREQFWRDHIAGWKSSGLSLRLYSEEQGLKAGTLSYWNPDKGFSGCGFEIVAELKVALGPDRVDLVGGDGGDDVNEGVDDGSMLGQIEG